MLTVSSSMTWKITSLSVGHQFWRKAAKSSTFRSTFQMSIPECWTPLRLADSGKLAHPKNLQLHWKTKQTCQVRKGNQKKGLKQSKTRYIHQDVRIKLKDSAICLLIFYWYLCSHDPPWTQITKSWRSRPPCAATCAWGQGPKCIFNNTLLESEKK